MKLLEIIISLNAFLVICLTFLHIKKSELIHQIESIKLLIADAYEGGIKDVCDRLVLDGAISQYKADMLTLHGVEWVEDKNGYT